MTISGLVLTFDLPDFETALRRLAAFDGVELGAPIDRRVPAVLSTADPLESEEVIDAVRSVPGVLFVDVVHVDFSDDEDP